MVGAHLGWLHPERATGMAQPGPDALPFPLVDALVPWQLLTPNSCSKNTASERLQSLRTSGNILGAVFSGGS